MIQTGCFKKKWSTAMTVYIKQSTVNLPVQHYKPCMIAVNSNFTQHLYKNSLEPLKLSRGPLHLTTNVPETHFWPFSYVIVTSMETEARLTSYADWVLVLCNTGRNSNRYWWNMLEYSGYTVSLNKHVEKKIFPFSTGKFILVSEQECSKEQTPYLHKHKCI